MKRATLDEADLSSLRDKYERMLALRRAHARARDDASFDEPDPAPEMARLAEQYPGALREIDTLPLEVIVGRVHELEAVAAEPSRANAWMVAQVLFHRYARGALAIKRWLAGQRTITPAVRDAFTAALRTMPRRHDAELYAGELERIANPPGGRLMNLVHRHVARALDVTDAEARVLVFGAPRARSRTV